MQLLVIQLFLEIIITNISMLQTDTNNTNNNNKNYNIISE